MSDGAFRLVVWNCFPGRLPEKLERLAALSPDLAVLPEASRPARVVDGLSWFGGKPSKGVAVYCGSRWRLEPLPVLPTPVWSVRPFRVHGPRSFTFLACWTRVPPGYVKSIDAALDSYGPSLRDGPLVVAGDFNANVIFDRPRMRFSFTRLAARLRDEFGLVSAYHRHFGEACGAETRPTHYFQFKEHQPFHIDYCFVPETWPVQSVEVGGYADWQDLSDHRPLTVEMEVLGS